MPWLCVWVCVCVCGGVNGLPLLSPLSLSLCVPQISVCVWLRADVSQWSGKLQQTYSCRLTLWLIWSVISPVFHLNRCDHSAVAGLSDLIKINSGVTGLPTELPPSSTNPRVPSAWRNPVAPINQHLQIQPPPLIRQLTHLGKFHNLHLLVVVTTACLYLPCFLF